MRSEKLYAGVAAMPTITDELLTRTDVARICKCSVLTVIRLEQSGKLEVLRLGAGSVRIRRSSLEKFLNASVTPKGAA
jgi:excisionase family DNA binding protein